MPPLAVIPRRAIVTARFRRSAGIPRGRLHAASLLQKPAWTFVQCFSTMASKATLDRLQAEFDSAPEHILAAVALLEDRASPAFIARHSGAATGDMFEDRLQAIADRLHFLTDMEQRKQTITQQAQERGRLSEGLQQTLNSTVDQDLLDDLYQSMRPRRRSSAMQMEEKGLMPLALAVQHRQLGEKSLQESAQEYVSEANGLPTIEAVLEGVLLILSEKFVYDPAVRESCRAELRRGVLRARAVNPGQGGAERYQQFFDFAEPISRISASRMLALRRAEREGILQLELGLPDQHHRELLRPLVGKDLIEGSMLRDFYDLVFDHAWNNGLQEGCSRDVRRRIKEKADREAVRSYARNLRSQLLAPPLGHKKVLSLRTSSKNVWAALLSEDGSVAQHKTLTCSTDEEKKATVEALVALIREQQPAAISVPHGRRQAGSEKLVEALRAAMTGEALPMVVPVDEAASAIFATSSDGRKSMSGVEVGIRTAVSLGRRLQDPLRELLHMEFRTLGLGQTLDDVHQGTLQRELEGVVSSCLATVGVDLNTAGVDLLAMVPGLNPELAKAIVEHRKKLGGFQSRALLAEVPGMAQVAKYVASFLTVEGGSEPLDRTTVQLADYDIARAIAAKKAMPIEQVFGADLREQRPEDYMGPEIDRRRVIGVFLSLCDAGKDPRGVLTPTVNPGVNGFDDLRPDLILRGRIASITEFGAFIDLGIGQDGLVHISQIPTFRLRDPQQMLRVGEVVDIWVVHVDREQKKISLSMLKPRQLQEAQKPPRSERSDRGGERTGRSENGDRGGERTGRNENGDRGDQGPRSRPRREPRETQPVFSRAARAPESRRFGKRSSPLTPEGKPLEGKDPKVEGEVAALPGAAPGRRDDRGPARSDRSDRPSRGGNDRGGFRGGSDQGARDSRVITVDSGREVTETKGHKGELTSLAGLRALLRKEPPAETKS